MILKRRNFLRDIAVGTGTLLTGMPAFARVVADESDRMQLKNGKPGPGLFNMSGYAAAKMDKVRIGVIGLGMRGPGAVERMSFIEGVEI